MVDLLTVDLGGKGAIRRVDEKRIDNFKRLDMSRNML